MDINIWQIYYNDATRQKVDKAFYPYLNHSCDKYFENSVVRKLIPLSTGDYTGVFSWKFSEKTGYTSENFMDKITGDADVYCFVYASEMSDRNMWVISEKWHQGIIEIGQILLDKLAPGHHLLGLNTPIIWQNHFVARTEVYKKYVADFLNPAIEMMEDAANSRLQHLLWQDSGYQELTRHRQDKVTTDMLRQICGVDYYPMHPFVCERLFSTYLALHPEIKIQTL